MSSLTTVISGLPSGTTLSAGSQVQSGVWSVPVAGLTGLEIAIPAAAAAGEAQLLLEVRTPGMDVVASGRMLLNISEAAPGDGRPSMAEPPRVDEGELTQLLAEGKKLMGTGHIAQARLVFRRAADSGNSEAARLLGDTYDPAKLFLLGVRGTTGDIEQAIYWYERADELGDPHAKARLLSLGAR